MARTNNPAPATARSAADIASNPVTTARSRPAGDGPTATILATLSAESGGATVVVIAEHAGISAAAARRPLLAQEKVGAATRVKTAAPGPLDHVEVRSRTGPARRSPRHWQHPRRAACPGPADDTAEGGAGEAGTEPGPDPAATAEAAGNVLAIAQAADGAGKALAAGELPAALTVLAAARAQATHGRRVIKAVTSGRRAPATRPGALHDLVEENLRKFPDATFTLAPGRQNAHPAGRRGRQRLGQTRQPQCRADGHWQATQLPARPRRPRTCPGHRRRPRRQRGGHAQRRVTRDTHQPGRDARGCRPGPRHLHVLPVLDPG